jgi:hypothetical protein
MKTVLLILSATLIFSGCNTGGKDEIMEFIPGTYVRTNLERNLTPLLSLSKILQQRNSKFKTAGVISGR